MSSTTKELLKSRTYIPSRKFRGQARYFKKVRRSAEQFSLTPYEGYWWDTWCYHADWPGWGNLKWSYRLEHIKALVTVFQAIAKARDQFTTPFQCWIQLSFANAGEDGTFLHTPNPNPKGVKFPYQPDGVDWEDNRLLPIFQDLLPEYNLRLGLISWIDNHDPTRDTRHFVVYSPDIGTPLQK